MIKLLSNIGTGVFLLGFFALAQAQEKVGTKFGDDFLEISWPALLFIFGYSALGSMWRLHQSIQNKEIVPSVREIAIFFLVGLIAGFTTHGICEVANSLSAYRMNDWVQGGFIFVGAFNHKRIIYLFTKAL